MVTMTTRQEITQFLVFVIIVLLIGQCMSGCATTVTCRTVCIPDEECKRVCKPIVEWNEENYCTDED